MRTTLMLTMIAVLFAVPAKAGDAVPAHLAPNIARAVRSSNAAAVVTVLGNNGTLAHLHVEQMVLGALPEDIAVQTKLFGADDLELGTRLLVFFRDGRPGEDPEPTGHYELVVDGQIREVSSEAWLTRVRSEAERKVAKPRAASKRTVASVRRGGPNS